MSVSSVNATISAASSNQLQAVERFEKAFEADFSLWGWEGEWHPLLRTREEAATAKPQVLAASARQLLDATRLQDSPQVAAIEEDRCLLAIPLGADPLLAVAVGSCPGKPPALLRRHAEVISEVSHLQQANARLSTVNQALTFQVSESFEELILLRELAAHLRLDQTQAGIQDVSAILLPQLRRTLRVESVAFVTVDGEAGSANANAGSDSCTALWDGDWRLDKQRCQELVCRFAEASFSKPVVQNDFDRHELAADFPEVREFVLVNVHQGPVRRWLIALNRVQDARTLEMTWRASEKHFGTVEATLLTSSASFLATHLNNVELLQQKDELFTEVVRALVNAVDARDPYTAGHSERVALFAKRLGQQIGLSDDHLDLLYLSGLLHDVGKLAVSDATLRNPRGLSDAEFAEISQHPNIGWSILNDLEHLRQVMPGVLFHHERVDGQGYPDGLVGDQIPLEGRIMAICDAYDAMTSDRPYRPGMPQEKAEAILRGGAGTQWDNQLIDAFFAAMPDIIQLRQDYRPREQQPRPTHPPQGGSA